MLICSSGLAPAGARLHHQLPEEGDAVSIWAGEEEGRADHEAARDLLHPAERAPHQPRRLPQRHQDAGTRLQFNQFIAKLVV